MTKITPRNVLFASLFLCIALGAVLGGRLALAEPDDISVAQDQADPRPVSLERVTRYGQGSDRTYPGSARAVQEADLAFRVSGPLIEVLVQAGDAVQAGDLLLSIDPRDFQDNVNVLEAQLAGAAASRDNARLNLDRLTPLLSQRVVSQSDYDNAKSLYDTSQATVRSLQAQLDIARHSLGDTSLTAPFDGMVTEIMVDNFEMVSAGQVVLRMQDISQLEIDVDVPENEIHTLGLGNGDIEARASFASVGDASYPVRLREWSGEADPATRTYLVTFIMDAPEDATVLPGMTSTVTLSSPEEASSPLVIPAGAVSTNQDGESIVWVFNQETSTASPRIVRTGPLAGGHYATVLEGLEEGELVVVAGLDFITEDMILRPLAPSSL